MQFFKSSSWPEVEYLFFGEVTFRDRDKEKKGILFDTWNKNTVKKMYLLAILELIETCMN